MWNNSNSSKSKSSSICSRINKNFKSDDNPNGETTNGTYKEYTVRVANNTTPEEYTIREDFSKTACGFVVEFVDIVGQGQMNPSGERI